MEKQYLTHTHKKLSFYKPRQIFAFERCVFIESPTSSVKLPFCILQIDDNLYGEWAKWSMKCNTRIVDKFSYIKVR